MRSRSPAVLLCLSLVAPLAMPGCGTSAASKDAAKSPLAADAAEGGAPHVFTPRAHPPRNRPAPPEPDIAALPAMIDRTSECFAAPQVEEPQIAKPQPTRKRASKKPSKSAKKKSGFVPFSPGSGSGAGGSSASSSSSPATKSARPDAKPSAPPPPRASAPAEPAKEKKADDAVAGAPAADAERAAAEPVQLAGDGDRSRDRDDGYQDWGAAIYLSNDDTMSLSSAQRIIYAIDNFMPLPAEHIRPHELLNYFKFDNAEVAESDDFSVRASIAPNPEEPGTYGLALGVKGRPMGVDDRRNANLAFVIDRSGSMSAEGRMSYLRRGMVQMLDQLKTGDLVHLVVFDHAVCTPVENFVVGRDSRRVLESAIAKLQPEGSTDLHLGMRRGYEVADRAYQPTYSNRVVMITDAQTNTGVLDEELISTVAKFYDSRRIRLSGVGVGSDFNDYLLDRLTERGRGAYVFLGSEAEVDAVFGDRFTSLVETTALDVHFRLHLPPSLRMNVFYGEESSTVKEDVQPIHYFANTSQLFLADLMARGGKLREQDGLMLTIEYEDPETGDAMVEEYAWTIDEINREDRNVRKGRLVMRFVDGLLATATRPAPAAFGSRPATWEDAEAFTACEEGHDDLQRMAEGLTDDPEVRRIVGLWEKYCSRFAAPRRPVRRDAAPDAWPGAVEP